MSGTDAMTWAALLAHWTEFARSAVALPDAGEAGRWKRSVPDVIALMALARALAHLHELDDTERALGLDRAEILIRQHAGNLYEHWRGEPLPGELDDIIEEALAMARAVRRAGLCWTLAGDRAVFAHPGELALVLIGLGFSGDLYLPTPGVAMFAGAPVAFVRTGVGNEPDPDVLGLIDAFVRDQPGSVDGPGPRPDLEQVYRQFDFGAGGAVRDVVAPAESALPGQPLLMPIVLEGRIQPVPMAIPGADRQRALPVVRLEENTDFEGLDS